MDLLGDQSVQVTTATAMLEAALVLLSALLALLLTAKLAQAVYPPAPALVPQPLAQSVTHSETRDIVAVLLVRCLPTRAPPDLSQRLGHSPPGACLR